MNKVLYLLRKEITQNDSLIEEYSGEIYDDAISCYKRLKEENPKVIVVDLGIDKITGLEVISIIRQNPKYHHIKIISVTKKFNERLADLAYSVGSDYYLTYPINKEFINKVIELSDFEKNMFK
mgnify:CR=1 FL=1